jgi:uncharacterized protein (DUF2252 family)
MMTIPSLADREALGREARVRLPRSAHAAWTPRSSDGVVGILARSAVGRVVELLPVRWQRMAVSPFAYFRGAAAVMAEDLLPRPTSGLAAQICGDAHVQNLGAYETAEGQLVFDINDFDETIVAAFEWELLRFATSLALSGTEAGESENRVKESIHAFVAAYRSAMRRFAAMPFLEILRFDIERHLRRGAVANVLRQAARTTPRETVDKLTKRSRAGLRFGLDKETLAIADSETSDVLASLIAYRATLPPDREAALGRYEAVDVAFKIAGTGSVGRRNYIVLLQGSLRDDAIVLQVKEVAASVYDRDGELSLHQGRRAVEGQRFMQRGTDPFLGWTSSEGRAYIVRQFKDHKASVEPGDLRGKAVIEYARVAGEVFARAHARSGDAVAIAAYCGRSSRLDRAISTYAIAYAEQTRIDYGEFRAALHDGRLATLPISPTSSPAAPPSRRRS